MHQTIARLVYVCFPGSVFASATRASREAVQKLETEILFAVQNQKLETEIRPRRTRSDAEREGGLTLLAM